MSSRPSNPIIVIAANSCWNIVNFRAGLIRAFRAQGYSVVVAAPRDEYTPKLETLGASFVDIPINSAGASVAQDLRLFWRYLRVLRRIRPVAYLGYTAKPDIYGSMAARAVGAKVIIISADWHGFHQANLLTRWSPDFTAPVSQGLDPSFSRQDDLALFVEKRLGRREHAQLLPGSGVDPDYFKPRQEARRRSPFASCS